MIFHVFFPVYTLIYILSGAMDSGVSFLGRKRRRLNLYLMRRLGRSGFAHTSLSLSPFFFFLDAAI